MSVELVTKEDFAMSLSEEDTVVSVHPMEGIVVYEMFQQDGRTYFYIDNPASPTNLKLSIPSQ